MKTNEELQITEEQRQNLTTLATYLDTLPKDYEHFNMASYMCVNHTDNFDQLKNYALLNGGVSECGTSACAVGHGPAAGLFFRENEFFEYEDGHIYPNWSVYCRRAFIDDGFTTNGVAWSFLFSSSWRHVDNTTRGAAARIRYFLDNGIPEEYYWVSGCLKSLPIYEPYLTPEEAT